MRLPFKFCIRRTLFSNFSTSLTILYADGVCDTCTHLPHVPVPCLSHYNLNSRLTDFPKTWLELHHSTLTSRTLFQNNNAVTTTNLLLCCAVLCWWDPPDKLRVVYIFGWKKSALRFAAHNCEGGCRRPRWWTPRGRPTTRATSPRFGSRPPTMDR